MAAVCLVIWVAVRVGQQPAAQVQAPPAAADPSLEVAQAFLAAGDVDARLNLVTEPEEVRLHLENYPEQARSGVAEGGGLFEVKELVTVGWVVLELVAVFWFPNRTYAASRPKCVPIGTHFGRGFGGLLDPAATRRGSSGYCLRDFHPGPDEEDARGGAEADVGRGAGDGSATDET